MPKRKKETNARKLKRFFNYLTVSTATLFGAYWVVMGITNANPSWEMTVSNILLVVLILSAIADGFVSSIESIKRKS
jgi:hypothetical protein